MKLVLFLSINLLVCSLGYQNIQQQRLIQPSFLQLRQNDTQASLPQGNIEDNKPLPSTEIQATTQPEEQSFETTPVVPQQSEQVASNLPAPAIPPPQEEKDLLLVVPFTKEQFEAEIKLQSQLLATQIVADHKSTMEQLKGISSESNRIIEEKGRMIGMYLNQTTTYLDNLGKILQRELEQNHSILVKLAESIVLSQNSNLEKEILSIQEQMKNILNKVQPPDSTCKKELNCGSCITRPDCVWSTDRRACFVGSKFDGCFFDFCEFFTRDHCVSNSQADPQGISMESYVFDEELAKNMEEAYSSQDVELAIQRIPSPQKNFMLAQQNKLIDLKDEIQKLRMFSNYMKRIYYKLRFQNVMLKRKLQRQAEEDKKFLEELEKSNSDFLKNIKESEEEKEISVGELISNEKAIEQARLEAMQARDGTIEPPKLNKQGKVIQKTKVKEDGSILDENGVPIEGVRVFEGKTIINESTKEARSDVKYENGYIMGEDGQVMSPQQLKEKLIAEETFVDGLLDFWYGPTPKEKKMDAADKLRIQKQRSPTEVDVDSAEIQDEEINILQHIADQLEAQELGKQQQQQTA